MTYSNRKEKQTNKVGKMDIISGDNVKKVAKIIYKSVHSTTFQLRSKISII